MRQAWVWLLCMGIAALAWWAFLEQIALGRPWGDRPAPDWAVWLIFFLFGLGLPAFLWHARMVVTVSPDEILIRWIPLWTRRVPISSIRSCEARTYRPIREYLGWGIRLGPSGRAYNVSGNEGVQLVLEGGERLLIGSRRMGELAEAIESLRSRADD